MLHLFHLDKDLNHGYTRQKFCHLKHLVILNIPTHPRFFLVYSTQATSFKFFSSLKLNDGLVTKPTHSGLQLGFFGISVAKRKDE